MAHEAVSTKLYFSIFAALIILTATTVGVTYIDVGRFNLVIALLIAVTKATLVVLFFMHVKQSSALTKIFVVAGLFWMAILITLTFTDYISQGWLPPGQGWTEPREK